MPSSNPVSKSLSGYARFGGLTLCVIGWLEKTVLQRSRLGNSFIVLFCLWLMTAMSICPSLADANQITLTWFESRGADIAGYRVFIRSLGQSFNYAYPGWEGARTSCAIELGRQPGWKSVVVRAFSGVGVESIDSNEVLYRNAMDTRHDSESVLPFSAVNGREFSIETIPDDVLESISPRFPEDLPDFMSDPEDLVFGKLEVDIHVDNPGDTAVVLIHSQEPIPEGFVWYAYHPELGWRMIDASLAASSDRRVTAVEVVDGDVWDHDGYLDGRICSALAVGPIDPALIPQAQPSGGGCFLSIFE